MNYFFTRVTTVRQVLSLSRGHPKKGRSIKDIKWHIKYNKY